jgi:uncharacterized membrane protein
LSPYTNKQLKSTSSCFHPSQSSVIGKIQLITDYSCIAVIV